VTIHAPVDAVVLEQKIAAGQHVEVGTELFRLSGARGLWLELQAPARYASRAHVGDVVSVAGCEDAGRVIAVGSQLDPASQTVPVRAEMRDSASECVRLNQYVEADVRPASAPPGLVSIPASALVRNADRDYVFAERAGGFAPVPVVVERRIGDAAWLRSGIAAGTRVATGGTTALKGAWLGFGPTLEAAVEKQ
jgi:multidrug efflux pump subunit AcrA (membrane-fusion protein)